MVRLATCGHRGRKQDPLYRARRTLHTGADLLTYRQKARLQALITTLGVGVPKALTELLTLGRTLNKRAADVSAYFNRPGTSNGPTEAVNGRLEHLRGCALGFRNLTN